MPFRPTVLPITVLDVDRGVATITLNRPSRRNAVGHGMVTELSDAYRWCDAADEVCAVVLTGAPPALCAGADLEAGSRSTSTAHRSARARRRFIWT